MHDFLERLKNEPVMLTALVVAILATAAAYGLMEVTPEQLKETESLVTLLVAFVVPLLLALFPRAKVTPTRKIEGAGIEPA